MEYAVLGWPEDDVTLRLDHEVFSYAGKFVMSNTGKAVAREGREARSVRESHGDSRSPPKAHGASEDASQRSSGRRSREGVVAAVAFNADRTDPDAAWLRYVTVRADRRGERIGARLAAFATERLHDRGYDRVTIAVNNPFAYQALYRAGFGYTGETTGLAELVLSRPGDRSTATYRAGLDVYREREDLSDAERSFLAEKATADPPSVVAAPES